MRVVWFAWPWHAADYNCSGHFKIAGEGEYRKGIKAEHASLVKSSSMHALNGDCNNIGVMSVHVMIAIKWKIYFPRKGVKHSFYCCIFPHQFVHGVYTPCSLAAISICSKHSKRNCMSFMLSMCVHIIITAIMLAGRSTRAWSNFCAVTCGKLESQDGNKGWGQSFPIQFRQKRSSKPWDAKYAPLQQGLTAIQNPTVLYFAL